MPMPLPLPLGLVLRGVLLALWALTAAAGDPSTPRWKVVVPSLAPDLALVAAYTVQDFGAKGDGLSDDTAAFQRGLDATARCGGGVLYAPAGRYALKGTLTIPCAVTLAGDWRRPQSGTPIAGTVLQVYAGRGEADGTPFIGIRECGGVRGLALWWPEQRSEDIAPYPYAIKQLGGDNATCRDLTLVNAYRGVLIGPDWNELHLLQDIYGTVLDLGICFDFTTDIGRLEAITLASWIWSGSGLPGAPAADGAHVRWMKEHGTGIHMLRSDWEYAASISISGYRTGLAISGSAKGFPNAQFWHLDITRCRTALEIRNANAIGLAFTSCTFQGDERGVATSHEYTSTSLFHDCSIAGAIAVELLGPGSGQFQHCTISGPLQVERGAVVVADCQLSAVPPAAHVTIGEAVITSAVVGNRSAATARIVNHSPSPLVVVDQAPLAQTRALPALPDLQAPRCRPGTDTLRVVPPTKHDGVSDDTAAIQAALDEAGRDGGGIVFLPGGIYALRGHLRVPSGVELRGVYAVPHHSLGKGSMLYAYEGKGAETGEPCIALAPRAGVRGLTIHYPDQDYDPPRPYPPTIQGRGAGVYVIDTTATNPWNFIDLATHRCHGHVLDYVAGSPLRLGIAIGAGCEDGQVRNMQFNPHYFHRGTHPRPAFDRLAKKKDHDPIWEFQKANLDALVLGSCSRELLFQNFVFGSLYGIHLVGDAGGGPSGWCLGHGTDGSKVSARIDGLGPTGMDFINAELVCMTAIDKTYIICGPALRSETRFFTTLLWGQPDLTAEIAAGTLHLQLANVVDHGRGLEMKGGAATVINAHFIHGASVVQGVAPSASADFAACLFARGLTMAQAGLTVGQDRNAMACVAMPPGERRIFATLGRIQEQHGLHLREQDGEAVQEAVERQGRWGWRCREGNYMYLAIDYGGFKDGAAPQVTLSIDYFDEGGGRVAVVYDAADRPWVEAGSFPLTGGGTWKHQELAIDRARFAGRCNGADLRLNLSGGARPVLGAVSLSKR